MAGAAIPVGASLLAPEAGAALASIPALSGIAAAAPWLLPAVAGAGLSGIGGIITGQNPLKSALLGGIGGGIGSAINSGGGLSGLFGGGVNPSTADTAGALASQTVGTNTLNDAAIGTSANLTGSNPLASSGLLYKALPFVAAGGAAALDSMNRPKQIGPTPQAHPSNPGPVAPLNRTQQSVNPNSYLTSVSDPNLRSYFSNINPQYQFMAKGGPAKKRGAIHYYAEGGEVSREDLYRAESNAILAKMGEENPMLEAAGHIVNRYNESDYPGSIVSYVKDEYGDVPVTREMIKAWASTGYGKGRNKGLSTFMGGDYYAKGGKVHRYASGGSSGASSSNIPMGLGRYVKGSGDGRSDSIPAMLSDGEFVVSAPAVSALGNGSNDAGAKKLSMMQRNIIHKHYGAKPRKSGGIGSYMH